MGDRIVVIAHCDTEVDAESYRQLLAEHDIDAFVDNSNIKTALSYVGSALGAIKLLTKESDAERAMDLLEANASCEPLGGEWNCGECGETNEPNFELCWSCGAERSTAEVAMPIATEADVDAEATDDFADPRAVAAAIPENRATDVSDSKNPYIAPLTASDEEPSEPAAEDPEVEAQVLRAWRGAIIGCVLLPIVLHFYSMFQLIQASRASETFSEKTNRRFYQAWCINLVSCFVWAILLRVFAW